MLKFMAVNLKTGFRVLWLLAAALPSGCAAASDTRDAAGPAGFIGLKDFSGFTTNAGTALGEAVLTSPEIKPPNAWDELVVSWNVPADVDLKVETRGIFPDHTTGFYTLGLWSDDPTRHPRASVNQQRDADGTVATDTLSLARRGAKVQLRITLGGPGAEGPAPVKFIGLSFYDTRAQSPSREPNRAAWGKTIPVPERRQADYEGGGGWCSPASLSMVLSHWGETLHRPGLDRPVPEVAAAIHDPTWGGTGNWPFNTAYAGGFPGLRAYVTRFDDLAEVEDWIVAGVPPILSVSSYLTNDRHGGPDNGHLIVCVGFTEQGDVVANDPGVSVRRGERARRVYPRARVLEAWKKSKNTVYLIYPDTLPLPKDRFGHWESSG
jgi:hypothetical protein